MKAMDQLPTQARMITGAPEGQDVFLLAERAIEAQRAGAIAIHVASDDARAHALIDLFHFFAPEIDIIHFPAWDCLPYDRVSPTTNIVGERMQALLNLKGRMDSDIKRPVLLITTANAFIRKIIHPDYLSDIGGFYIEKGGVLDIEKLQLFTAQNGYERTDTVRASGEYAIRGGIIDIWPATMDRPVRVDLFGDDVESVKYFEPSSQRSENTISHLSLNPASEIPLDDKSVQRFRSNYRALFGAVNDEDPLYEAISDNRRIDGIEHWQSLFFDKMASLNDYAPSALVSLDHQADQVFKDNLIQTEDFYQARATIAAQTIKENKKVKNGQTQSIYHPVPVQQVFDTSSLYEQWDMLSPFPAMDNDARQGRDFADIRSRPDADVFAEVHDYIRGFKDKKIIINAYSTGARDRLQGLLTNAGIENIKTCETFEQVKKLNTKHIAIITLPLERGFVNDRFVILTEQDILGDRLIRKSKTRKRKSDAFLREVSSLNAGDYIVHVDHGIGRFQGLEAVDIGGAKHDCVCLVYDGGDKLFVPVENIDVLSRYGDADSAANLDKLGGVGWQARRAKVKKNLLEMAGKLIDIAAARALQTADHFSVDSGVYNDFAARFPFHETEDQLSSIGAVLGDLNGGKPMDRLVCGDVGFGKTEVAIRAAYVTAMAGGQVAIIAPTTLLARQHFENFSKRFTGTPLRIGHLSRLASEKDKKQTKNELRSGDCQIVIGTHALLSDSIKFSHLGLVIIDEEQRFGVKQKERLKDLRKDVHVLTLTATPIPRTLQMALTGVRDMSLITTPPVDRLAIRSFVMPFDPVIVREALMREHHRGGQSFIVCPRVKDLQDMEDIIRELCPDLKLIAAHGQLPSTDLEDRMTAFYEKKYDILLATNIIESGIDVPSANTMIVHRADMFGLAQLYQIRGRIGRSKLRAYAYLTYKPDIKLSQTAMKRLEVIGTLDTLGAGFQLASHDMDIRGAGNMVGEQQSGHVREVGVELYQQMLEEAVADARTKGDKKNPSGTAVISNDWTPDINLGSAILIPDTYVSDLSVRMGLYRRIASLSDKAEIESFAAELIDRFGDIPDEVENLLQLITIKQLCRQANVNKVEAGPKGVVVGFYNNTPTNPEGLMLYVQAKAGTVKVRPDQRLFYPRGWTSAEQRLNGTRNILKELTAL
jgi:transcription-repair coupling factor (superfamily II helicase)